MPLDTSIAQSYRPSVQLRDPMDVRQQALTLRKMTGAGQMQDMQIDQARQQQEQERTLADIYRNAGTSVADGQPNHGAIAQQMASQGLGKMIPGYLKSVADAQKAQVDVGHVQAQTSELGMKTRTGDYDLRLKKSNQAIKDISALQSPEQARASLLQHVQAGDIDPGVGFTLHQQIPQDPAGFSKWKRSMLLQIMDAKAQLEATTPKVETTDLGNRSARRLVNPLTGDVISQTESVKAPEGFIVGPDGRLSADPGYVAAKSQIARAGATNLNVNATKPLINTMAEGLGKQLDDSLSGAQTAQQTISTTQKLQALVNSGKLIAGPGADARIVGNQIAQALGIGGANDEERLASTRQAIQNLAALELQAGASMKGQGAITESERAILKSAAAGSINMTGPELKALSQTLEDRAYKRIETHQTSVKRLEAIPEAKQLMPFYSIDAPPRAQVVAPATDWKGAGYASKAQAVQDALGAIQRGADKAVVVQRLEAAGITGHGIK